MITFIHNPRCSKSREAQEILKSLNVDFETFEYLKEGLSPDFIKSLAQKLQLPVADILRTKESEYKELQLKNADEETIINALALHPKLLERPIIIKQDKAIIARPPSLINDFL